MTPAELDALDGLLEKATPGPWRLETIKGEMEGSFQVSCDYLDVIGPQMQTVEIDNPQSINVAVSIALRNAAPALLVAARQNERLREAIAAFLAKFDELSPHVDDFIQFATIHHMPWKYGNWTAEIDALRAVIKEMASDAQMVQVREDIAKEIGT